MPDNDDLKNPPAVESNGGEDNQPLSKDVTDLSIIDTIPPRNRTPDQYMATLGERYGIWKGDEFIQQDHPPRESILGPWLVRQSLTMLYAERGLGKSMLMMALGLAAAKGEAFLDYSAGPPIKVLYVDGEMPPSLLKERLTLLGGGVIPKTFTVISVPSAHDPAWADLNEEDGRFTLEEIIDVLKPDLVILDNKSTLMPPRHENDAESWSAIQRWLIRLRHKGLAVVLVHHAGKGGKQRGTSLTEVVLDTIIRLGKYGATGQEVTTFTMDFEKARHFYGAETASKVITLDTRSGKAEWSATALDTQENPRQAEARRLSSEGLTQREIALRLGVSPASINDWLKPK